MGRYGSYVKHQTSYASLEPGDDVLHVGLNRAITLLAEKALRGGKGRRGVPAGKLLGEHPEFGGPVTLREGRFGPYVQLGEQKDKDDEKPKRAGLPKGTELDSVDLKYALALLSLPREVGKHPESGEPILAGMGRYGSYVKHQTSYASLEPGDDVLHVGLNRAITLLAEKALRGGKGRRGVPAGKLLGEHPEFGGPVTLREGRFGPYVTHNKVNATIPNTSDPEDVTLDQAVALITDRIAKTGGQPPKKKAAAKKKPAKAKAKPTKEKVAKEKPTNGEAIEKPEKPKKKKTAKKKTPAAAKKAAAAGDAPVKEVPASEAPALSKTEPVQD
jgi:DNA topoisomerase-1